MCGQYGYYAGNKTIPEISAEVIQNLNPSGDKNLKASEIDSYICENYNKGYLLSPEVIGYLRFQTKYPISILSSEKSSIHKIVNSLYRIASSLRKTLD